MTDTTPQQCVTFQHSSQNAEIFTFHIHSDAPPHITSGRPVCKSSQAIREILRRLFLSLPEIKPGDKTSYQTRLQTMMQYITKLETGHVSELFTQYLSSIAGDGPSSHERNDLFKWLQPYGEYPVQEENIPVMLVYDWASAFARTLRLYSLETNANKKLSNEALTILEQHTPYSVLLTLVNWEETFATDDEYADYEHAAYEQEIIASVIARKHNTVNISKELDYVYQQVVARNSQLFNKVNEYIDTPLPWYNDLISKW